MCLYSELKSDYMSLCYIDRLCDSCLKEQKKALNEIAKSIKKRIRNTIKEEQTKDVWHYDKYGYNRWCKFVYDELPEEWYDSMSRDEAICEYKNDEWQHFYNLYNDGRDCTGVWFTSHIYVFPIEKLHITIIYHFQSCDV